MARFFQTKLAYFVLGGTLVMAGYVIGNADHANEALAQSSTSFGQYAMVPVEKEGFVVVRQGVKFFMIKNDGSTQWVKAAP